MSEVLALDSNAVISPCGLYRYWLERGPAGAPYVAWVLANPSTADASLDDPTVRKARGFTQRWGYQRFVFVNLFAYRSTDPRGLLKAKNPWGPQNDDYIRHAVMAADFVVLAWGNAVVKPLRERCRVVSKFVQRERAADKIKCLGYTADRQPRHPLMLAYDTPLEVYRP